MNRQKVVFIRDVALFVFPFTQFFFILNREMDSSGVMPRIQNITVDEHLPAVRFRCDVKRCKGACCTIPGGKGAPLRDEEIEEIHRAFPVIRKYLSKKHLAVIESDGLFEGEPGELVTTCVEHKACVFVTYEDGIARCAFEKAYLNGETDWRKPLSCHLFPIRIDRGIDGERVRYEYLRDCDPALETGASENLPLSDFLREALVRAYGEDWYNQFVEYCRSASPLHSSQGS